LGTGQFSSDAAQESAAAWNADDDAHEDKSEIDEQLNCVRHTNSLHSQLQRGAVSTDSFFFDTRSRFACSLVAMCLLQQRS
jgi:hypothetical protein